MATWVPFRTSATPSCGYKLCVWPRMIRIHPSARVMLPPQAVCAHLGSPRCLLTRISMKDCGLRPASLARWMGCAVVSGLRLTSRPQLHVVTLRAFVPGWPHVVMPMPCPHDTKASCGCRCHPTGFTPDDCTQAVRRSWGRPLHEVLRPVVKPHGAHAGGAMLLRVVAVVRLHASLLALMLEKTPFKHHADHTHSRRAPPRTCAPCWRGRPPWRASCLHTWVSHLSDGRGL